VTELQHHLPTDPTAWISTNITDGTASSAVLCHGRFAQASEMVNMAKQPRAQPEVAAKPMDTQMLSSWL